MLTEVHRQALDSPILRLATMAREGKVIPFGDYGAARVLKLTMATQHEAFRQGTWLLCGIHRVRKHVTRQIRHIRGFGGTEPMAGEPIICGKNNRERNLFNGLEGVLLKAPTPYRRKDGDDDLYSRYVEIDVRMDDHRSDLVKLLCDPWQFEAHFGDVEQPRMKKNIEWMDWGYARTVHKAQGSEAEDVTVIDDSGAFGEHRHRHAYTAYTRASERLTVLRRS
jgi:exodeoxyribonuclease-5